MLPILLGVALFGQIFFAAFKFYWGVEHIGRACWGALFVCIPLLLHRHRASLRLTAMDRCFAAYVGLILLSYFLHGAGNMREFAYDITFFCVLPYTTARLITLTTVRSMLRTITTLGTIALPVVLIAFLQLPAPLFFSDRPYLFEVANAMGVVRGYSFDFLTISIGALLLLKYAKTLAPDAVTRIYTPPRMIGSVCLAMLAMWLMVRLGLRSGVVALAASVLTMACLARWQSYRIRIAGVLLFAVALLVSVYAQPPERIRLLAQMLQLTDLSFGYGNLPYPFNWTCMVLGDSIATRINYLNTAIRLFLESPVFGVGTGVFGHRYCDTITDFASPHSSMLHILSELGIVGLLLGCVWLGYLYKSYREAFRQCDTATITVLWYVGSLWLFFFLWAQMNGNYLTDFQFYALTGLLTGCLAQTKPRVVLAV